MEYSDGGGEVFSDVLITKISSTDKAIMGDMDLIPRLGRSPGEGNHYPLQYSCLENPMDRGVRQATVHGVAKT